MYGNYFVFSLRIDKKNMSPKLIKKHFAMESARHLASSERQFLSRNEKKVLKDHVLQKLSVRIPATPSIYDTIWNYEESCLWFFSNLKTANEELEKIFSHSFQLTLLRLFPYTDAYLTMALSGPEKDQLTSLSPSGFTE